MLNPFIKYSDMINFYLIQAIDLRFRVDHITPKKIQLWEEYRVPANIARKLVILIKRRQIKMISDGHKIIQEKIISKDKT